MSVPTCQSRHRNHCVRHERGRRHGGLQRAWAASTMPRNAVVCAHARAHIGMRAVRLVVLRVAVRRMPRREAVPAVAAVSGPVRSKLTAAMSVERADHSTHSLTRPTSAPGLARPHLRRDSLGPVPHPAASSLLISTPSAKPSVRSGLSSRGAAGREATGWLQGVWLWANSIRRTVGPCRGVLR